MKQLRNFLKMINIYSRSVRDLSNDEYYLTQLLKQKGYNITQNGNADEVFSEIEEKSIY